MPQESFSRESVESVQGKLQELFESLPDHERPVLQTLFAHAAQHSAAGGPPDGDETSIIIVGGRHGQPMNIRLRPGVISELNPQPIPPGRSGNLREPGS